MDFMMVLVALWIIPPSKLVNKDIDTMQMNIMLRTEGFMWIFIIELRDVGVYGVGVYGSDIWIINIILNG
jgi:hypothetical protein